MRGDSNLNKLNKLIKYFSDGKVESGPGMPLTYWSPKTSALDQTKAPGLVKKGNGSCGAFADLFFVVAKRAGITSGDDLSMVSLNLIPPEVDQLLLVGRHWKVTVGKEELSISERKEFPKKWDTDVSFKGVVNTLYPHRNDPVKFTRDLSKAYTDKKPTPGQNNEKPSVSMFPDHAVVLVREKANVYVFDPSYKGSQPKMFAIKGPSNLDGQKLVDSEAGQAALRAYQNLAFGGFVKFKRTPISKDSVVYELKARGLSDDSELLIKVRLAIPYK